MKNKSKNEKKKITKTIKKVENKNRKQKTKTKTKTKIIKLKMVGDTSGLPWLWHNLLFCNFDENGMETYNKLIKTYL